MYYWDSFDCEVSCEELIPEGYEDYLDYCEHPEKYMEPEEEKD